MCHFRWLFLTCRHLLSHCHPYRNRSQQKPKASDTHPNLSYTIYNTCQLSPRFLLDINEYRETEKPIFEKYRTIPKRILNNSIRPIKISNFHCIFPKFQRHPPHLLGSGVISCGSKQLHEPRIWYLQMGAWAVGVTQRRWKRMV
jgi:hypothetical protein